MNIFIFFFQELLIFTVPLLVAAMAAMFCERCGILDLAIEGTMLIGASCGVFFLHYFNAEGTGGQGMYLMTLLIAGLGGLLFSMLLAVATIFFNANQAMCGVALNMLAPALSIFASRMLLNMQIITFKNSFMISEIPILSKIPIIGDILFKKAYISTFIAIALYIICAIIINRTRFGMRLRACGENPHAVDSVGVNVYTTRFFAVLISGFLAGLSGIILVLPSSVDFNSTVGGYGFLAMAVLILGRWRPKGILVASLLFGASKTLASVYTIFPVLGELGIDAYIYRCIPYVVTILALTISAGRTQWAPSASNKPYVKGER